MYLCVFWLLILDLGFWEYKKGKYLDYFFIEVNNLKKGVLIFEVLKSFDGIFEFMLLCVCDEM